MSAVKRCDDRNREPGRYERFMGSPPPRSNAAFLLRALQIRDEAPEIGFWGDLKDCADHTSPRSRSLINRHNDFAKVVEGIWRKNASDRLHAAGLPSRKLTEPAAQDIVGQLAQAQQHEAAAWHANRPMKFKPKKGEPVLQPKHLMVLGAGSLLRFIHGAPASSGSIATFLNEDMPKGSKGLTRYHVDRSIESARKGIGRCSALYGSLERAAEANLFASFSLVAVLTGVRCDAARDIHLRRYKGADLANAIDDRHDICAIIERRLAIADMRETEGNIWTGIARGIGAM